MAGDDLVEKIRYEADISDITTKLRTLADKQDKLAGETEKSAGRMSKSYGGLKSLLSSSSTWFAGLAGGGAAVAVKNILDTGGALSALDVKAQTVFTGSSLQSVQAWSSKVAASFGLTKTQTTAMAASMGDLFKPMGFTSDQAAGMAVKLGDLSGALSAWSGGTRSAKEVSEIITKSMLGERDALKELGVSISDADVQQRLAANGQSKLTGASLEQAKALITMQLIQEKSTDAQKAWTDGSMDSIKKQNESKASLKQLGETFTRTVFPVLEKLVPIVQKVAEWIGERLPAAFEKLKGFFEKVLGGGKKLIDDLAKAFGTSHKTILMVLGGIAAALIVVAVAWNAGPGLIVTAIAALVAGFLWAYDNVDWFRKGLQSAFGFVKEAFDIVSIAVQAVWDWLQKLWDRAEPFRAFLAGAFRLVMLPLKVEWELFSGAVQLVWGWLQKLWDKAEPLRAFLAGAFTAGVGVARSVFSGLSSVVEWLAGKLDWLVDKLGAVIGWSKSAINWVLSLLGTAQVDATGSIAPGAFGPAPLPMAVHRHNGGVVPGLPGTERMMVLQAGEQVLTGQQQQSGNKAGGTHIDTLNVYTGGDSPRRWLDELSWRVAG